MGVKRSRFSVSGSYGCSTLGLLITCSQAHRKNEKKASGLRRQSAYTLANKKKSQFRVSVLALEGSLNIPERKELPAAPFTSANALVNSLAGFLFFAEILETCSVSGTAYWVFRKMNDRMLTFRVTVGIFGCRIRTSRSHLPQHTKFQ